MSRSKLNLALVIWCIAFSVYIISFLSKDFPSAFNSILPAQQTKVLIPAGEITPGFYLEQPIDWVLLRDFEKVSTNPACVSLFLASYGGRKNMGMFKLTLKVENSVNEVFEKANLIRDNALHRFCFENAIIGQIVNKPAALILEGVDSPPGSAITAWLTSGSAEDGIPNRRNNLIFSIGAERAPVKQRRQSLVLIVIFGLSGTLLFLPHLGHTKPNKAQSKEPHR